MGPRNGYIEDDHLPFLQKNVPILHLIAYPFPSVWHSASDTYKNVDWKSVEDITKVLTVYMARLLDVKYVDSGSSTHSIDQSKSSSDSSNTNHNNSDQEEASCASKHDVI